MKREIYLAAGCFWGAEHYLKCVEGVLSTEVGFANGNTEHPSYKEVYTDTTGYAECVHVIYDDALLPLAKLLEIYFKAIDPTSLNKQGEDEGTRYRTGIYYLPANEASELPVIRREFDAVQQRESLPLRVEVLPLRNFWPAEEYHQDYLNKHPEGYCHLPLALFEYARKANQRQADAEQKTSGEQ